MKRAPLSFSKEDETNRWITIQFAGQFYESESCVGGEKSQLIRFSRNKKEVKESKHEEHKKGLRKC